METRLSKLGIDDVVAITCVDERITYFRGLTTGKGVTGVTTQTSLGEINPIGGNGPKVLNPNLVVLTPKDLVSNAANQTAVTDPVFILENFDLKPYIPIIGLGAFALAFAWVLKK